MDFGEATVKIAAIASTVDEYVEKINEIREKYIKKINGYLEDLEHTINNAVSRSQKWIDMQVNKTTKRIQDALSSLTKTVQDIINQLKAWYETTISKIKISILRAAFIKINQPLSDEEAALMESAIPHPSIESLLPDFSLHLEISDPAQLMNAGPIELPRL